MLKANSPVSSSTPNPNQEFHKYRKLVAWGSLSVVATASVFLMVSVGVSIKRQRNAEVGQKVSEQFTSVELQRCHEELNDISLALEKHLESAYHLLRGYDSDEAGRWGEEGDVWRRRWVVLGERCRLSNPGTVTAQKELESMVAAYQELGNIQTTYSNELLRFGKDLAPRLDRLKKHMEHLGARVWAKSPSSGETR